jgi:hypothetical protein
MGTPVSRIGIAKILKKLQLHPRQGCHPVDVGLDARTDMWKEFGASTGVLTTRKSALLIFITLPAFAGCALESFTYEKTVNTT